MTLYKFLYTCLAWIFRLIYRVHSHGEDTIPKEGACIIAPNHTSALDCIMIAVSAPRQVYFMSKAELFKIPVFAGLIRALGAFPVKRKEGDVVAVKKSISLLKDGNALCMFPQGTRCPYVELEETRDKLKWGVGLIAEKSGSDIIPVYIRTKHNKLKLFRRTDVYYGAPVSVSEFADFEGRDRHARASALVFDRICELRDAAKTEETK